MIATQKQTRPRRGGPRTFSRDAAVETAMRLFWCHGYEGVSISDLVAAIGIAPPSLYAAFGSKAEFYREALDRCATLPGVPDGLGSTDSPEGAAADILGRVLRAVTAPEDERGCMVSTGMMQSGAEHAEVARDLAARRGAVRAAIALEFGRWLEAPAAAAMAGHVVTVMQGLAIQARDGASRTELQRDVTAGIRARQPTAAHDSPNP